MIRRSLAALLALGLATRDRHGTVGLCHEGSTAGFRAMMCLYPQARRGYFVGLNTDSEDGGHVRVYEGLTRSLELPTTAAAPALPATTSAADWNDRYARAPGRLQAFAAVDLLTDTRVWQAAWVSVLLGAAGLPWWLLAPPWQRWRQGARLRRPGWLVTLALWR